MALAWSNMQCIPTKEYAGSTFFRGCSVSLVIELKLVVRLILRSELRKSYNKIMKMYVVKMFILRSMFLYVASDKRIHLF